MAKIVVLNEELHISFTTEMTSTSGRKYKEQRALTVLNPIHLLTIAEYLTVEEMSEALELFRTMKVEEKREKAIHFESDKEREEYLEGLYNSVDQYTQYIDNFRQQESAEKSNQAKYNQIEAINKYGHIPTTISKRVITHYMIPQAYSILRGLKIRNDKLIIAHLINWIKNSMGFKKTHTDEKTKTVYYTSTTLTDEFEHMFRACFAIKKVKDGYSVEFLYDYPRVKTMKDGIKPIWETKNAHSLYIEGGFLIY